MAEPTTAGAGRPPAFDFDKVHTCKIHPGIGIARVGNSREEYFIGPEIPQNPQTITAPNGAFKDADGRIKRQAARFRIYAYDKDGNNLGELPLRALAAETGQSAHVEWRVHLKNKKGAWYNFSSPFDNPTTHRNPDIRVQDGLEPDSRLTLVIDPGPRGIDGEGIPVSQGGGAKSTRFDTGRFQETTVPLGELKVDEHGRLLVLGGPGKSGSVTSDPIGTKSDRTDYWVNNDNWYDDTSDGPVTAKVTLPNGDSIIIDQPQDAAWIIVCPPNYAPGIYSIVTLYDVMRQAAIDNGWIKDNPQDITILFFRDIYPVLSRVTELAWVNQEAQRGHGFDKRSHFPPDPSVMSSALFGRLRTPLPMNGRPTDQELTEATKRATPHFMPPLSGDDGPRTEGDPRTWLSLLPWQYEKFQFWAGEVGEEPTFPPLDNMKPDEQVEALQRGALEPCAGGPFHPGIEVPRIVKKKELYAAPFRINSSSHGPGDITKSMGVPWQATYYDCKDTWWPAVRPDDVIPQDVFEEVNKATRPQEIPVSEALEGRVKWDRGLGVTTLFRHPWKNPPPKPDDLEDPRDADRRGCDDMVRYWHELGFVLPRQTSWRDSGGIKREIVHVEMERRPHAGMDVRELFHCLLNLEENRSCLPKVMEYVENVLEAARQVQQTEGAFAFMENIRPFEYDESLFDARMQDIYDDTADYAFTEQTKDGIRVPFDPNDEAQNPFFRTREDVIERIRQLTPFNFLDGSWLRNIHRVGPVDEVNAILFTILKEELGDGVASQNHANIYRDLCHSFGFYPPPIQSIAFARDPAFLDCAFDSPTFQLGISEFSRHYYPEIIGMSLWLEWTVMELHRIASIVEKIANLSSHFYRMHIAIDNAASGHGAEIVRAVKLYLQQIRVEGGEEAVQQHWKRIWDGYVAFAYTFVIVIQQIKKILNRPPPLQQQLESLIMRKAPYGRLNHNRHRLPDDNDPDAPTINSLFADPPALLEALKKSKHVVPGKPEESKFFELLEFRGGPMYHVFTEDEIKLWRDWIRSLGPGTAERRAEGDLPALKDRIAMIDPGLVDVATDEQLKTWRTAASDHRIALWTAIASKKTAMKNNISRVDLARSEQRDDVHSSIHDRYTTWLGWGMIRTLTFIAAQHRDPVGKSDLTLADYDTGQELTMTEWLDRIRKSSNPSVPARALLQSLRNLPDDKRRALVNQLGPETPMGAVLGAPIPGNDARRGSDIMEAWLQAGCPVPVVPAGRVKPLRLDSTLDEEETHPIGFAIGFGTVH